MNNEVGPSGPSDVRNELETGEGLAKALEVQVAHARRNGARIEAAVHQAHEGLGGKLEIDGAAVRRVA